MFIKKTKKTDPKTQKSYFIYQLVESIRTERGPRQRFLLSFDSKFDLPKEEHKNLANRIEEIVSGQNSFISCSKKIEDLAQKYASQLILRFTKKEMPKQVPQETDYQTIDINTVEQQEPKTIGAEHLLLHIASQLNIEKKLQELGLSKTEIALSLGTILGRAIFPGSERSTHNHLICNSGLGELLDFNFQKISLNRFYKISDILLKHKPVLEKYLAKEQQKVHNYQSTMILYDLTNTYMEGRAKNNPKAKHGFSKEKRSDCPLVTLGLVINEYGFSIRSEILPGNISESGSFKKAINSLHDPNDLIKPTLIIDAGIATEDNLKWLREKQYTYIVSARQRAPSIELETELVPVGNPEKTLVKAALVKSNGIEERWLYCESEAKKAVSSQMKEFFKKRFETDLKKMAEGLKKPKGRKQLQKVIERLGRLKEKHRRISGCYEILIKPASDGLTAISIDWKLLSDKIEDRLNGHYFLRTNLTDLGAEKLWNFYNRLRKVEDSFRFMKSDLGMRPIYHQKEKRVDGHLWITLLAYHLIQSCLYQLQQHGISHHWNTICKWMKTRIRVTMRAKKESGTVFYHRSTTKPEEVHKQIYQAMGMSSKILKAKKIIV